MTAFWDIIPCSIVEVNLRFRFTALIIGKDVLLKRRPTSPRLHNATFQKAVIFTFINCLNEYAVKKKTYF
jgi:hypothetical protein